MSAFKSQGTTYSAVKFNGTFTVPGLPPCDRSCSTHLHRALEQSVKAIAVIQVDSPEWSKAASFLGESRHQAQAHWGSGHAILLLRFGIEQLLQHRKRILIPRRSPKSILAPHNR